MEIKEIRRKRLAEWFSSRSIPPKEKSYISQLLKGTGPFGERAARRLESVYGMGEGYLDEAPGLAPPLHARGPERRHSDSQQSNVFALHPDDDLPDQVVYVPESKIEFSAGPGSAAGFEIVEDNEPATYRLSWFQKYGINPERVRRFRVSGDSMEPMLFAKDTILVNLDETHVVDGHLYAIRYGDELRVKFLSRRLDGTVILRSANPLYKPEELSPELASEHVTVIGRVRDKSGTGGL